jgi:hypothetical protein
MAKDLVNLNLLPRRYIASTFAQVQLKLSQG